MVVKDRTRLTRVLSAAAALGILAVIARLVMAAGTITIFVDDDSTCTTGCGDAGAPHGTIAAAITDANNRIVAAEADSVIIQVAAGNYPERILIVPNVHVRCASPTTTTINATGLGRSAVIFSGGGTGRPRRDFSIDGCRITGGSGEDRTTELTIAGGGVFVFGDAVVSNNVITGNVLSGPEIDWLGAGVYVAYGNAAITGNTITRNLTAPPANEFVDAFGVGGGIYVVGPERGVFTTVRIEGNTVADNVAIAQIGKAAGIRVDGNPGSVVTRNIVIGNRASYSGGAMEVRNTLTLTDNLFYGNSAGRFGGALDVYEANARVTNNTIIGNTLTENDLPVGYTYASYGGGVYVGALFSQDPPRVQVTNNLIIGNQVASSGSGGGLCTQRTTPTTTNNDLLANLRLPASASNVSGDFTEAQVIGVNGNVSVDPRFVRSPQFVDVTLTLGTATTVAVRDAARYLVNQVLEYNNDGFARTITAVNTATNTVTFLPALTASSLPFKMVAIWGSSNVQEDFRLQSNSPVIDAGTNTGVSTLDLPGNPRVLDGVPDGTATADMGAYEFVPPDADGDGVQDALDCAPTTPSVQTPPGPMGQTLIARGAELTTLRWGKIPQAYIYNVYRGTISTPWVYDHTCLEAGSPDLASQDGLVPPVDGALYYLVSGVNTCAEGILGRTSSGVDISNPNPCTRPTTDRDGDGLRDIDDNCPLVSNATQVDADGDRAGDACDNCPGLSNPDQMDSNGDGFGDLCQPPDNDGDGVAMGLDCNDANPTMWLPPTEVRDLILPDLTTLTWTVPADPGATTWLYDVVSSANANDFTNGAVCVATDISATTTTDASLPPVDGSIFYLARAQNSCPNGQGPLGFSSSGVLRTGRTCP